MPLRSPGLVLIAHGGCGAAGDCHAQIAAVLHGYRLGTRLVDLRAGEGLLDRALDRALDGERTERAAVGLLGEGIAAAAVLQFAAERPGRVAALVTVEGEPDLAGAQLARVHAPTLLIVGGHDAGTLARARETMRRLHCDKRLEIVPGATRLCDDAGALAAVAHLSGAWLANHLPDRRCP